MTPGRPSVSPATADPCHRPGPTTPAALGSTSSAARYRARFTVPRAASHGRRQPAPAASTNCSQRLITRGACARTSTTLRSEPRENAKPQDERRRSHPRRRRPEASDARKHPLRHSRPARRRPPPTRESRPPPRGLKRMIRAAGRRRLARAATAARPEANDPRRRPTTGPRQRLTIDSQEHTITNAHARRSTAAAPPTCCLIMAGATQHPVGDPPRRLPAICGRQPSNFPPAHEESRARRRLCQDRR
jgi:hypothetical protein